MRWYQYNSMIGMVEAMERSGSVENRIGALKKALRDPNEGVRRKAAESLSLITNRSNMDTYARILNGDDRAAKMQVIYLLAEIATETARELMLNCMDDPHEDVRAAVVRALGGSLDNYTTHELRMKTLDIALRGLEDSSVSIRISAAGVLAKFGDPRSVDALLAALEKETDDKTESNQLVVNTLLALGAIKDRKALPSIMEKTASSNPEIQEAALKALGMIGDPGAEDYLIRALTNENDRVRMQAADALGRMETIPNRGPTLCDKESRSRNTKSSGG